MSEHCGRPAARCPRCRRAWTETGRELDELELALLALAGELAQPDVPVLACDTCPDGPIFVLDERDD